MAGGAHEPGRSSASRVLAVLGAFDADHRRLQLSDISRRSGLPLSTAHRAVAELTAWGALERSSDSSYRVGLRLWELGQLAPERLRDKAKPWLQELFDVTREHVHLAVLDGDDALYIDKLTGRRAVPVSSRVGGRLPLHTTGVGKVLLAFRPDRERNAYLRRPLLRPTPYAHVEPGRLHRELQLIRDRGWATTSEEMTLGSCSLAAPVHADAEVVAAVGIVVAVRRAEELPRLLPALLRITGDLGHALTHSNMS